MRMVAAKRGTGCGSGCHCGGRCRGRGMGDDVGASLGPYTPTDLSDSIDYSTINANADLPDQLYQLANPTGANASTYGAPGPSQTQLPTNFVIPTASQVVAAGIPNSNAPSSFTTFFQGKTAGVSNTAWAAVIGIGALLAMMSGGKRRR